MVFLLLVLLLLPGDLSFSSDDGVVADKERSKVQWWLIVRSKAEVRGFRED